MAHEPDGWAADDRPDDDRSADPGDDGARGPPGMTYAGRRTTELEFCMERAIREGDLALEESLKHFERGIALTRQCQGPCGSRSSGYRS